MFSIPWISEVRLPVKLNESRQRIALPSGAWRRRAPATGPSRTSRARPRSPWPGVMAVE